MQKETLDQPLKEKSELNIQTPAVRLGIIGGFVTVIVSLVLYFTGLQMETWARWIASLIMAGVIISGIKMIADENSNKLIPFGSLFKAGMIITAIIAVFSLVYFFIFINFIEVNFIDKVLEVSRKEMEAKGMTEAQIEMGIAMTRKFTSPAMMVVFSMAGTFVVGAIASVIGSAIFKQES